MKKTYFRALFLILFAWHSNAIAQNHFDLTTTAALLPDDGAAWEFPTPSRLIAIGDLHGDFEAMMTILEGHRLVDINGHWTGGTANLVFIGDLNDRGEGTRSILDLIMRLEQEAITAGGRIHTLLGNHEVMVAGLEYHYVSPGEFESFRGYGGTEEYLDGMGFRAAFSGDTPYTRWIESRNAIVKVGNVIFVHAGLGQWTTAPGFTIGQMNSTIRGWLKYFHNPKTKPKPPQNTEWALRKTGPLWIRDYALSELDPDTSSLIDRVLAHLRATQIVVGHTMVEKPVIENDHRVFRIDSGNSKAYLERRPSSIITSIEITPTEVHRSVFQRNPFAHPLVARLRGITPKFRNILGTLCHGLLTKPVTERFPRF